MRRGPTVVGIYNDGDTYDARGVRRVGEKSRRPPNETNDIGFSVRAMTYSRLL